MKKANDLGKDSIGKLLLRMSLPAILAQLVNVLYSIVDRMYIGRMAGVGDIALTGVGVVFPIITLISAFSALVGMGGSTRASIAMGQGDMDKAERILGNCISLLCVLSVVLTTVFLVFRTPMLNAFGASPSTFGYANSYLVIYVSGTIFVQVALGLNSFINAQGYAKTGMMTVVIGAVINIVLDPIFIFAFKMGVAGAALATILSQAVSAAWVFGFLLSKRSILKIRLKNLRLSWKILGPILALGLSPFIMQSTESLVQITLNSGLQRYGGDLYVGANTIMGSIMQVFLMPVMGLTQGAQPILGYNYGARQLDRVKKTFKLLLISGLALALTFWGVLMLFPKIFILIFNDKPELVELTAWAIRIFFGATGLMGIQLACQQTLLAVGEAKTSIFLALLRKIVLLIPLALILPRFWGATGIFVAEPIADFLAIVTTSIVFAIQFRKVLARGGPESPAKS